MAQSETPFNLWLFKADFEKETNLKANENILSYMAYFQLRQNDGLRKSLALCTNHVVEVIREFQGPKK